MTSNKHQWREINRYSALICYLYLFKSTFIYTRGIIEGVNLIHNDIQLNKTKKRKNNNKQKSWQSESSLVEEAEVLKKTSNTLQILS